MSSQPSFSSSLWSELASASWHWCRLAKQPDLADGTNYCEHTSRAVFKMPSSPSTLKLLEWHPSFMEPVKSLLKGFTQLPTQER